MLMVLDGKNKTGFVDDSILAPDSSQPLYPFWIHNKKLVLSWILRSVSPTISKSILYSKSARVAWTVLRQRFSQDQGTQSVTKYFTELVTHYDELQNFRPIPDCDCSPVCSCSLAKIHLYQEQNSVIRFLRGLNENFSSPRSQVMLLEPLPSLNKVFAMVIQQERDIGAYSHSQPIGESQSHAFLAKTGPPQALAPRPPVFKKQGKRSVCSYCGFVGHTVEVCYKKNGYPPGYQHRLRAPSRANAVATMPVDANVH
ncbi:hypothetical protein LINPERHAP1_LOCUS14592 [Linum perenne]